MHTEQSVADFHLALWEHFNKFLENNIFVSPTHEVLVRRNERYHRERYLKIMQSDPNFFNGTSIKPDVAGRLMVGPS